RAPNRTHRVSAVARPAPLASESVGSAAPERVGPHTAARAPPGRIHRVGRQTCETSRPRAGSTGEPVLARHVPRADESVAAAALRLDVLQSAGLAQLGAQSADEDLQVLRS